MLLITIFIIAGLVLLAVGSEILVRGSSGIALRLGVAPLVIGLTVVAFGTGTPELFVSIEAALNNNGGIALGNVIGSNISNIALILGLAAIVRPMRVRSELIRREVPLMIAVTILLCVLLHDGSLSRLDGFLLTIGSIVYTIFVYWAAKRDQDKVVAAEFDEVIGTEQKRPVWLHIGFVLVGFVALLAGAKLLVNGATTIAEQFGISQVVIGLTIIAIGTSLPELATSVVATIKDEADVAFGNAIGSNILNILCILGITAIINPFEVQGLRAIDYLVFAGSAILLLPLLWRGSILNRWEGMVLVGGYILYLYSLIV